MSADQRLLRGVAIVLNVMAIAWWTWNSILVTSKSGWPALASSGGLFSLALMMPPIVAILALSWSGNALPNSN